jgi:hypothetical protein
LKSQNLDFSEASKQLHLRRLYLATHRLMIHWSRLPLFPPFMAVGRKSGARR